MFPFGGGFVAQWCPFFLFLGKGSPLNSTKTSADSFFPMGIHWASESLTPQMLSARLAACDAACGQPGYRAGEGGQLPLLATFCAE